MPLRDPMSRPLRWVVAVLAGMGAYLLALFLVLAFLPESLSGLVGPLLALAVGVSAGIATWRQTDDPSAGLGVSVALGALVLGGLGFALGFFGPMFLAPQANQGPLLGIFITGPVGLLLGGVGGAWLWLRRLPASQRRGRGR